MFYDNFLQFIQVISVFQIFRKLEQSSLDATAQSLFTALKNHKSAEAIILTRKSYENIVCLAALQQGFEIENITAICCRFGKRFFVKICATCNYKVYRL